MAVRRILSSECPLDNCGAALSYRSGAWNLVRAGGCAWVDLVAGEASKYCL